jgi:multicomponent Na+:H+ antiporter subunit D
MLIAMGLGALLCVFNGSYPALLYSLLPYPVDYAPYTASHVVLQVQLLFFSALAFVLLKLTGLYPPELRSVNIDTDWTYRRLLPQTADAFMRWGQPLRTALLTICKDAVHTGISGLRLLHSPQGIFGRTWHTGNSVLICLISLAVYLVFYYL